MKKMVAVLFGLIILSGCASTKVTSFKDSAYAKPNYSKVLVFYNRDNLEGRQNVEKALVRILNEQGTPAVAMIDLIPPTRKLEKQEIKQVVLDNGCDCILHVKFGSAHVEYGQTGGSAYTSWSKGSAYTFYNPPMTYSLPRVQMSAELFDTGTGKTVWTSSSKTAGNAYASGNVMVDSFASEIVKKLQEDGLISKPKSN